MMTSLHLRGVFLLVCVCCKYLANGQSNEAEISLPDIVVDSDGNIVTKASDSNIPLQVESDDQARTDGIEVHCWTTEGDCENSNIPCCEEVMKGSASFGDQRLDHSEHIIEDSKEEMTVSGGSESGDIENKFQDGGKNARNCLRRCPQKRPSDDSIATFSNEGYQLPKEEILQKQEADEEPMVSSGTVEDISLRLSNVTGNATVTNSTSASSNNSKQATCKEIDRDEPIRDVEIINATTLQKLLTSNPNITSRSTAATCHLIYFFSPYCPFSIQGSAYVNGLARSLQNIYVYGLDSVEHHSMNARYGVMGTPTLILFHNGNVVGRYNASEYSAASLTAFIKHFTSQEVPNVNITSQDFKANLPAVVAVAFPYTLWAAWAFIIGCAIWVFLSSDLWARLTEAILNNWREAEAQHAHDD